MAATPRFKVYDKHGEYLAACKRPEEAAAVVALLGDGATIRDGHKSVVWCEGSEDAPAGDSFDHVAAVVLDRCNTEVREENA